MGSLDRFGEPRLAERSAVRPAERIDAQHAGIPAGRLGAWTR
jgi:hypothetical protein